MSLFKEAEKLKNGWLHYESDSGLLPYSFGLLRPDDDKTNAVTHKNVVLFLHGYKDSESYKEDKMTDFAKLCRNHHVALAHPNCGPCWWDKFKVKIPLDVDPVFRFQEFDETSPTNYLENLLLPHLEESQPEGGAWRTPILMGVSMGGHGVLKMALNNPDRYQRVAAISAAVRLNISESEHKNVAMTIRNVFGEEAETESVISMVEHVEQTPESILMTCGTEDPLFYQANVLVATKLKTMNKNLRWIPINGMGHNWEAFNKGALEIFSILFGEQ